MLVRGAWRGTVGIMAVGKLLSPPWGVHVSGEQGAFGSKLLRAVIESSHPNMNTGDLDSAQA